jgi:tricorn protease
MEIFRHRAIQGLTAAFAVAFAVAPVRGQTLVSTAGTSGLRAPDGEPTRLVRRPTLSATQISFEYGNDIWIVPRTGGEARRLTSFQGQETNPSFSPDGAWVAFSAQYGGNTDVFLLPVEGGEPRRLTFHPGADVVKGWTRDGRRVVFASSRTNAPSGQKFWTVSVEGGFPDELPMPRADQGSFSPDGRRFAYRMVTPWEDEWRNYRGGQNRPIWILDLDDYDLEEVRPWDGSNDQDPVWVGDVVYFLSDRDWAMNVWSYDARTKQMAQVTRFTDFDVKNLDTDGRTLVFEQAGYIHTLDPASAQTKRVDIIARGDFPWLMARWEDVGTRLTNPQLSPTGVRAVFEARGEIFTVPAESEKGDWRNLTQTPGVADRTPAWSPDGKWISYFTDESGEYQLVIAPQDGIGERRVIAFADPKFYYTPAWSPDSKKILFTDTDLRLWIVDVEGAQPRHIDTDTYMVPQRSVDPVWSPDSRWIAYAKRLPNLLHAVFVYSVEEGRTRQVTDGYSDAFSPAWDAAGKFLYFLASTDFALNTGWLDMTSYDRPSTRGIYLAVLPDDEPSPLLPATGDEPARDSTAAPGRDQGQDERTERQQAPGQASGQTSRQPPVRVDIDFEGLADRIVPIDVPERAYASLAAGPEGMIFYLESAGGGGPGGGTSLQRYSLEEREGRQFMAGVSSFTLSADRKKLLYRAGQNWGIVDSDKAPPQAGAGRIDVAGLRMRVDPKAEFEQMFDEGWRFQRDYLYVDNMHGVDYARMKAMYSPLVEHVAHRSDLTYLLDWMGGEVAIGHSFVRGGDMPDVDDVPVGLLGADLEVANGRYRIARIYTGESWNPGLRGPLAAPGIIVNEGDYLLAVNGVELRAPDSPYRLFEGTANRQTVIRVGPNASLDGSREVTVVPVTSEAALRREAWVADNRRKVDELSGGKLAYVWVPNTGRGGYDSFNRWYFAQQDRQGAIVDERFNSGGSAADYIVEVMMREPHGYFNNPVGERTPFTSPAAGIWGPKVMIINEMAGSGGDLMPYMFRYYGVGPLVGKRTWGGLVGTWDTPQLLDGGSMIAPRGGFFDIDGEWRVENEGTPPDIDVEMTPKEVIAGGDPQLERAVQEALRLLEESPVVLKPEPPPPVRSRRPGGR